MRKWKCRQGHITLANLRPDVCRECKKEDGSLWISWFKEIKESA